MSDVIQYATRPTVGRYEHAVVDADVCFSRGEEIGEDTAATIAAGWMSAGSTGHHLAALASTGRADVDGLLDNIHYARKFANDAWDVVALDMLATHVLRHPSRKQQ